MIERKVLYGIYPTPEARDLFNKTEYNLLVWAVRGGPTADKLAARKLHLTKQSLKNCWQSIGSTIEDKYGIDPGKKPQIIYILLQKNVLTLLPIGEYLWNTDHDFCYNMSDD